jgi:tetratricopeptide (TPR) repeat protein
MRVWLTLNRWYKAVLSYIHYSIGLTHRYWGNAHGLQSEYEKAIEQFNRALSYKPDYARIYLDRGILYWREMDHPRRAIHDLTQALTLDPGLAEAQFNRGIAHQQLREYDEAIADFNQYLKDGDHPYWREYAESMVNELTEWTSKSKTSKPPSKTTGIKTRTQTRF